MIIPDEIAGQPVQTLELVIAEIPMGRLPFALAVNPSTNLIYVALSDTTTVSVIDGKTNNVTKTIPVGEFQWDIALNPSTNLIYVSDAAQTEVWVIDGNNI